MLSPAFIGYTRHAATPKLLHMLQVATGRKFTPQNKAIVNHLTELLLQRMEADHLVNNAMRQAIASQLGMQQLQIVFT